MCLVPSAQNRLHDPPRPAEAPVYPRIKKDYSFVLVSKVMLQNGSSNPCTLSSKLGHFGDGSSVGDYDCHNDGEHETFVNSTCFHSRV